MHKLTAISTLALACAANSPVFANSNLEEIVIVSSRVPMPLRQVATSVSVISNTEIQQRGFNSLFDVLRSEPSISVSNNGGPGKATSLRIRGEESFRTLVLLDGINISDASGTQIGPKLEHLLSSGIQRVEVLRGPQGLMYGADAGGVVSISTEMPASESVNGVISAESGRYGTQQYAANFGGGNEVVDFSLSATDYETDGFNTRGEDSLLRDEDGYSNTTVHGRLGWNLTEDLRLGLVLRDVEGENEFDNCGFQVHDCNNDTDQTAWRAVVDYSSGSFTHQLSYSGNETDRKFYTEGIATFVTEGELESWSYLGSFSTGDSLRLVYGVDLETASVDDGTDDIERDQEGYYAEYQGSFNDNLFITAGLRHDDNDDFGTHTSYRTSLAYLLPTQGGQIKLKASYGTGFRAPSPSEIAYNNGPFAFSPASETVLSEEKSKGYDLGLIWYGDSGLYLEAVYFNQTVTDEIFFERTAFSGYLQGDGDTDSEGVELIGEIEVFDALTLSANYTYNDTDNSSGTQRARRPKHLANVGIDWHSVDDRLQLGMNFRSARDAQERDGTELDDYEVLDINASYEILEGLQIYGRVENVVDEDYQEIPDYNTSGSAAYAGVRYAF